MAGMTLFPLITVWPPVLGLPPPAYMLNIDGSCARVQPKANVHNKRLIHSVATLLVCKWLDSWVSTYHVALFLCLSYGMTSHGGTAQENSPFTLCRGKPGMFQSHDWKSELITMMTTGISINLIISDIVHESERYRLFLLPVLCTALHIVIKVSSLHHSWWLRSNFLICKHFHWQKQLFEHEFYGLLRNHFLLHLLYTQNLQAHTSCTCIITLTHSVMHTSTH